jgi:hypothetical protein
LRRTGGKSERRENRLHRNAAHEITPHIIGGANLARLEAAAPLPSRGVARTALKRPQSK